MLTPSDIHYLVGLLTSTATGEDMEIELGDMIYDESVDKERDVDVTVVKNLANGSKEIYQAYEVKDHSKPLDVAHVEQLCIKMADMPSIKTKYIVSSSGYTQTAKLKADYHGVTLLEILPWVDTTQGFEFWQTSKENYGFIDNYFEWPWYQITWNFDIQTPIMTNEPLNDYTPICDEKDQSFPQAKILKDLVPLLFNQLQSLWGESDLAKEMEPESSMRIKQETQLQEEVFIKIDGKKIKIRNADFFAIVTRRKITHNGEFKILRKVGDIKPISGCAIFINKDGHLAGLAISNIDQRKSLICVPYQDRIKKIHKKKLVRGNADIQ